MDTFFIGRDRSVAGTITLLMRRRSDGVIEVLDEVWTPSEPSQEQIVPPLLPTPSNT